MSDTGQKIGRISDDAVFYLMSRGISEEDASLIVSGFADNVSKELPLEYAVGDEQSDPSGNERKYWMMENAEDQPAPSKTWNWRKINETAVSGFLSPERMK